MCGIVGFWGQTSDPHIIVNNMVKHLHHRGPDSEGIWVSPEDHIAFGHSRLSIIDLSSSGQQPMVSKCGKYSLIYNGEIYNHNELRLLLSKSNHSIEWSGSSDSETLLQILIHFGVESSLNKLNGMFAFAFWDNSLKTLTLARDRMGEKPLYYGLSKNIFLFGSQLNALTAHPSWYGDVDRNALASYLRFSNVPTPMSIYKGIYKLEPAHFITVSDCGKNRTSPKCYWNLSEIASEEISPKHTPVEELVDELEYLLRDSVKKQMLADVPLGAFLSGGYDSSMITALMQAQCDRPVKTFSIGFEEKSFNEAIYAQNVSKYLGTDHTELYVTSDDAISLIPNLANIYDEPFSDVSQIPTFLVSELAKQKVKVCLSGDGGDELFCGYNRYIKGYKIWNNLRKLPLFSREILALILNKVPLDILDDLQHFLPSRMRSISFAEQIPKLTDVLIHNDVLSYYKNVVTNTKNSLDIVLNSAESQSLLDTHSSTNILSLQNKMMFWDMMTYLPDDILTKVDRASMAVGLEARVPFLDHRLVEFSCKIPLSLKLKHGQGKWLLRQVLYRYVPKRIMDRPKKGFGVPIARWLKEPLRDWAEALLDESRLSNDGYFEPKKVRKKWNDFIRGRRNLQYQIWDILMFQLWLENK